jgi:hypothetical protein
VNCEFRVNVCALKPKSLLFKKVHEERDIAITIMMMMVIGAIVELKNNNCVIVCVLKSTK